ncbi:SpoIIE family protein phosphatase [Streptomyces sp. NBC_01242]|uniref:PP2C family protein-serine/threonine phosphatase n=1 Tax=unclassified Streptomyces TaxID=2593676 RepID=UPI00225A992C|nr:GAF domain-containing SpoIIE family protein phosphatase [Streptomyces sp. NBC_01242]MCX4792874.1 SpoIIE family protein phosphatase [Streptomyces sp. NBC_01242]WSP59615.1 SpoIIE family protein phosphatase [Streptomyces sp. NBC_01241]WSU19865.1 SpoIIE family protein phosphatase [Streptomyces sp. NBC_01108]
MAGGSREEGPEQPHGSDLLRRLDAELGRIDEQLRALSAAKHRIQGLLDAVVAITREVELPAVLHRIVTTAMDLVGARYGALGVLDESGDHLAQFIVAGMTEEEHAALSGVEFPRGLGVLGHLIHHPEPLRVDDICCHPASAGFPPGHPPMHTLLGVAISVRGEIYGDLYLSERRDGQPFDVHDEGILVALASAAGIAIDNVRLFEQVRAGSEQFQRLLLPTLPDLRPFDAAAIYRPAAEPSPLGGDWYDAILLPDGAAAIVIGDVLGHDLRAAAAMASTRNMLRSLLFDLRTPPSAVLAHLDHTLQAITDNPITTVSLARIEPAGGAWRLHWSSAGHVPPLLITPDRQAQYLFAEPGLPLNVDSEQHRPDHTHPLPSDATVVFFTDGLVEHPAYSLDEGLNALAELATAYAALPLPDLVQALADHHPGDGHDDMAILALRIPH